MHTDSASPASTTNDAHDFFGPPVSIYTRADALADGSLIDVTEAASEAGFKWPVALSRATWNDCVAWSEADTARQVVQDIDGRLWDVLMMAKLAVRLSKKEKVGEPLFFQLRRVPRGGSGHLPRLTTLKLLSGPGDDGKPVMTIVLPDES